MVKRGPLVRREAEATAQLAERPLLNGDASSFIYGEPTQAANTRRLTPMFAWASTCRRRAQRPICFGAARDKKSPVKGRHPILPRVSGQGPTNDMPRRASHPDNMRRSCDRMASQSSCGVGSGGSIACIPLPASQCAAWSLSLTWLLTAPRFEVTAEVDPDGAQPSTVQIPMTRGQSSDFQRSQSGSEEFLAYKKPCSKHFRCGDAKFPWLALGIACQCSLALACSTATRLDIFVKSLRQLT